MTSNVRVLKSEEWDLQLVPDLTGKVALVTGANSSLGIGWNIARQLGLKGAKVYVGARSLEKAEGAINELKAASPSIPASNLAPFVAELSELPQVQKAALEFISTEERLDILVHNAALVPRDLDFDKHGISLSFVTNHLGVFVLTMALLPLLKMTALRVPGVRVVTLSSTVHEAVPAGTRFDSIQAFNNDFGGKDGMTFNFLRYGYSKLANILFAAELQRKFDAEEVHAISVSLHPGAVTTNGAIQAVGRDMKRLEGNLTPHQGAITPVYAATAPEVWTEKEKYGGQFLMPFGVPSPECTSDLAKSRELGEELWKTSEEVVTKYLTQ